jgi:hypothetical protein
MPSLVPFISNIFTFIDIQSAIFNWTYLCCDWLFMDKSMRVTIHICSQILGTISGLRYAKSGTSQIQYNYNSSYAGFNIQLNVSSSILVICRHINERYTPDLLPNTQHNIRFTLCHLWSRSYPIYLNLLIFSLQYSILRISAAIGCLWTNWCVLQSTFAANYTAQYPVYAMPSLVPFISNIITFLDIQASMFNWTYFLRYGWYIDSSVLVILHICCKIKRVSSYFRYVKSGPSQIQYDNSSSYAGVNIQLNVPPLRLVLYWRIDACYTPHLLPNKSRILLFSLCQQWSRSNKM